VATINRSIRLSVEGGGVVVQEIRNVGDQAERNLKRVGDAADGSTQRLGVMKGAVSNLGFQVQDFAVQISSGTSAVQAFSQQFPQLASGFGPVGIAIGTVAAVLVALGGAFLNFKTQTVTSQDAMTNALSSPFISGQAEAERYIEVINRASREQRRFIADTSKAAATLAVAEVDKLGAAIPTDSLEGRLRRQLLTAPQDGRSIGLADTGLSIAAARKNTTLAISKMVEAAKRGDSTGIRNLANEFDLLSDATTSDAIVALMAKADSIALLNANSNLDVKALEKLTPPDKEGKRDPFKSTTARLQAQLTGITNPTQGIVESAILSAGGRENLTKEQQDEITALAVAIGKATEAKKAYTSATAEMAREDKQAATIIEELQRRLGVFEDNRGGFIARFVNRIDAQIDPRKLQQIKQLAGELFDTEQKQRMARETEAQRRRESRDADEVFAGLNAEFRNRKLALENSPLAADGAFRGLRDVARAAADAGAQIQASIVGAFSSAEDALVSFVTTGKAEFKDFTQSILGDLLRLTIRQTITAPFAGFLAGMFPAKAHTGGVAGDGYLTQSLPRFHSGGMTSDEFPAILQRGERVQSRTEVAMGRNEPNVSVNIDARGAGDPAMIARIAREQARRGVVEGLDQASRRRRGGGLLQA
jgi:lambda family phage tail tape measure protein